MLQSYYFSASNTTETVVKALAESLGIEHTSHNLTPKDSNDLSIPGKEDIVIFASPVYGGRIPELVADKFRNIKGSGQKCVAVIVYGNRDYDDALVELRDLAAENGFEVVAAGAFVARHCIFPAVASERPDKQDLDKIAEFAAEIKSVISNSSTLAPESIKGNRPYKKAAGVPLSPKVDKKKCNSCGRCAKECPTGAISIENKMKTDADKCISCSRCIVVCPNNARHFGGLLYGSIAPLFKKKCSSRREPEWFVAK